MQSSGSHDEAAHALSLPRLLRCLRILVHLRLLLLWLLLLGLLLHRRVPDCGAMGTIFSRLVPDASEDFDAEALVEIIVASEVAVGIPPVTFVAAAVVDALEPTH